jgi:hypothetical protein
MAFTRSLSALAFLSCLCLVPGAFGGVISVYSGAGTPTLADWGIGGITSTTVGAGGWGLPNDGAGTHSVGGFQFSYFLEDTDNSAGHAAFLGPNYGGQDYDAEFLAVGKDAGRIVIAIVTGQRPDNGFSYFAPGDIRIGTSEGFFGVEVGGGAEKGSPGPGTQQGEVQEHAPGSTYLLNSSGFTTGVLLSDGTAYPTGASGSAGTENPSGNQAVAISPLQVAGSVWKDPTWILDPINPQTAVQLQFTAGSPLGIADFYYSRDTVVMGDNGKKHAIIEVAIPEWMFGGAIIQSVEWAPACGNDFLLVETEIHTMPEPGSCVLLAMGAACLAGVRRRRSRRFLTRAP